MKIIIRILLLSILLLSFQCDENESNVSEITSQQLILKKQQILDYIRSFSCNSSSNCNYIAFGSKPCGGPREYLVYPSTVNQTILENLVNEYNKMDNQHNIQTGAVSDCMVVIPPKNIDCINGNCIITD